MTNKTEQCLQMHLSRLLSIKLNCAVLDVANKLAATIDVSPSNTAKVMRAVDNVIGDNVVVFCAKIDHSNGVPPTLKMPKSNSSYEVNTLAIMLNKYLDDGHDIYGSVAATAGVYRDSTTRVLNVLADWLHDHRVTPMYMAHPTPSMEVHPTNERGEFAQPHNVTFKVHNNFELGFATMLSNVMNNVAVKSQQLTSANLSLKIANYDRESLVKAAVAALNKAYKAKDDAEAARATRSLIGYLVMFLALAKDAHDNYGGGTAAHWSLSSVMMALTLDLVNPEYETIIRTQQKENEAARIECEKLRNELHEANAANKKHYDINAKLREEIAQLRGSASYKKASAATPTANIADAHIGALDISTSGIGSYSVKTDANGHASGIGFLNQLPELKLPSSTQSAKEVYAFYGDVTININEGK